MQLSGANQIKFNKHLFVLIFILFTANIFSSSAQRKWNYSGQVNIGCNFNLTYGGSQKFPGLKIFAGFNVAAVYKHLMVNYGPSLSIYTKTIGANLNPLVGDIQIDFTNSISVGYAGGIDTFIKYFRTIHTGDYYNVATNRKYAGLLTSNFVLNNHGRNQVVGAITLSTPIFTFLFYNDGAFPFEQIPFADNFDRWWTGGGTLFIHNKKGYNDVEFSFDQFTGYTTLLYEASMLLGINVPLYDDDSTSTKKRPATFNTSTYDLKIFPDKNFGVNVGVMGSLYFGGRSYSIQDIIHIKGGFALHPNNDINRIYFGGTYKNLSNVKF